MSKIGILSVAVAALGFTLTSFAASMHSAIITVPANELTGGAPKVEKPIPTLIIRAAETGKPIQIECKGLNISSGTLKIYLEKNMDPQTLTSTSKEITTMTEGRSTQLSVLELEPSSDLQATGTLTCRLQSAVAYENAAQ